MIVVELSRLRGNPENKRDPQIVSLANVYEDRQDLVCWLVSGWFRLIGGQRILEWSWPTTAPHSCIVKCHRLTREPDQVQIRSLQQIYLSGGIASHSTITCSSESIEPYQLLDINLSVRSLLELVSQALRLYLIPPGDTINSYKAKDLLPYLVAYRGINENFIRTLLSCS